MWLVKLSIERPILISMVNLFIFVLGSVAFLKLGVDQFPKIEPPVITVTINYPGAGPAEIESLVTKPVEEEINQIGGIERLVSTSRDSISQIVVEFKLEVNAREALLDVRDKVNRAKPKIPEETEEPVIERLDFSDRPIALLALQRTSVQSSSTTTKLEEARLRVFAEERLAPMLQTVDGVGRIDVAGGMEREVLIEMDMQRILANNLNPAEVRSALLASNMNIPAGEINEQPRSRSIRLIGEFRKISDIQHTVVKELSGGRIIQIKDIATVKDGFKDRTSLARLNGRSIVLIEVRKQSDANTVKVADHLKKRIIETETLIGQDYKLDLVLDGSRTIRNTLHDVIETLLIAGFLAIVVVYFFLGSLQSTLITGLALPTSIIGTFLALYLFDHTLNVMTLLGITLSVGLILDDAIVVRENIWSLIEKGIDPKVAALEGTGQVFIAVIATSLTVLAVFIPVTFIPGIVGKFFAAFAITVCFGVICSTFDAITMAPMLSAYLVPKAGHKDEIKKPHRIFAALPIQRIFAPIGIRVKGATLACSEGYRFLLKQALSHPKKVLGLSFVLFLVTVYLGRYVGFTFLPQEESGEIEVAFEAPSGTTADTMAKVIAEIESLAQRRPEVSTVTSRMGNNFDEVNAATIYVSLVPHRLRELTTSDMIALLQDRLKSLFDREKLTGSVRPGGAGGRGKPISLVVQGSDNEVLFRIGNQIVKELTENFSNLRNVDVNLKPGREEIQLEPDREIMAQHGLSVRGVGDALRGFFAGDKAGKFREQGFEFDIRTRLSQEDRLRSDIIPNLSLLNQRGEAISIGNVTTQRTRFSPAKIVRIDQNRSALIEADLAPGAPLSEALGKIQAYVNPLLPQGYRAEFQGQAKSLNDLAFGAMMAMLLGAVFIYMIMASLYESLLTPFSILLTLPLAIVGSIAALLIAQKNLDVYGVIGMILLMGLVTKNAILLVDYVEQLRKEGLSHLDALFQGSVRRARPILMTSLAMIAGMIPVAIGYGEVNKIRAAMGIACIGGMISSTLLSLLVVPCFYTVIESMRSWRKSSTKPSKMSENSKVMT